MAGQLPVLYAYMFGRFWVTYGGRAEGMERGIEQGLGEKLEKL